MDGPLRFSEIKQLVPDLSDRLLSERLKELEAEGIVDRRLTGSEPGARGVRPDRQGTRARTRRAGPEELGPLLPLVHMLTRGGWR